MAKVLEMDITKEGITAERIRKTRENLWGISRLGLREKERHIIGVRRG